VFQPHVSYDQQADAIYVYLTDAEVARTRMLDDFRNVDLDADGGVVGVEFLGVSGGIDLRNIPFRRTVEQLLEEGGLRFPMFA
jgi:uncharacterized protein YuzE